MESQLASRKRSVGHYFPRILAIVLLIVGIVTAVFNITFGGFTPILWFLLALADLLIVTCSEVFKDRRLSGRQETEVGKIEAKRACRDILTAGLNQALTIYACLSKMYSSFFSNIRTAAYLRAG